MYAWTTRYGFDGICCFVAFSDDANGLLMSVFEYSNTRLNAEQTRNPFEPSEAMDPRRDSIILRLLLTLCISWPPNATILRMPISKHFQITNQLHEDGWHLWIFVRSSFERCYSCGPRGTLLCLNKQRGAQTMMRRSCPVNRHSLHVATFAYSSATTYNASTSITEEWQKQEQKTSQQARMCGNSD